MLCLIPMVSVALSFSKAAPASLPYRWKSVVIGTQGNEIKEAVTDLVSPREGPHLISRFRGLGTFTHWNLNRAPAGTLTNAALGDTESLSVAVDCPLLVARAQKGSSKNGGYSIDGGATWNDFPTEPAGASGGSIVFNSTAQVIVWSTGGTTWRSFDFGKSWGQSKGLDGDPELVADGVTPTRTYALSGSELYSSDDTAGSFQPIASVGLPSNHGRMRATEYQVGDLWIPSQEGLYHSVDAGRHFQKLMQIDGVESVGFGKPAPGKLYPTVFANGKIDGTPGVFRSDDEGQTWTRISTPANTFDYQGVLTGDPRIYGRVYLGTQTRGILYADPTR